MPATSDIGNFASKCCAAEMREPLHKNGGPSNESSNLRPGEHERKRPISRNAVTRIGRVLQRRGWTVTAEYVDVGISGAKERRPELDRLLADAHRRRFDAIVVWKFDRFARSVSHLLRALETFQSLGIEFVSLTEGVDTSTPAGKMIFTVLGAVAELERSLICERVRAGLRNAKAKGKRLGRPKKVLDVAKIAELHKRGRSWRKIARVMECSARTARRALQNVGQKGRKGDFAPHEDKNPTSDVKTSAEGLAATL